MIAIANVKINFFFPMTKILTFRVIKVMAKLLSPKGCKNQEKAL